MAGFAEPSEKEPEILRIAGPPPVRGFPLFHKGCASLDVALEEEMHHAVWYGRLAGHMMGRHEDGLWFHRHNTTDGVGHYYLGPVDPKACAYDERNLEANWDSLRRWYRTVDALLGEIMSIDPRGRFAMCTDHGNVGYSRLVSLGRLFVNEGLAHEKQDRPTLDQPNSKVMVSANEIFVNLRSRNPPGPVPDEEYEDVRSRVLELLRGLKDPASSRHIVSLAIRREEASSLLFWGPCRGDVLYYLDGGYLCPGPYVGKEIFQSSRVERHTSEHYGCLPGYETDIGSTYSFMAFSGHVAGQRRIQELGPVHLVDFAPTVLSVFGISVPWLQGRVLREMIGPVNDSDRMWEPGTPSPKFGDHQAKEDWIKPT